MSILNLKNNKDKHEKKNNKNLYIRVTDNLEIKVTCNYFFTKLSIKKVLEDNKNELALCVDNCAAIEFTDQFISVIKSSKKAKAYKAYYKDRLYLEEIN